MSTPDITPCEIYRCSRQDEMYLYVRQGFDLEKLPTDLVERIGRLTSVMSLDLSPQRKLARVDVTQVISRLQADGWFLQLPPPEHVQAHLQDGD